LNKAILQFNDLVMRFPKGKYASAALLREAQAFLKLNDRIDARLTLQKLVAITVEPGSDRGKHYDERSRERLRSKTLPKRSREMAAATDPWR